MSKSSSNKWALKTLAALVVGYAVGVLTAPKSGKETRQTLKENANQTITQAEKELKRIHTELTNGIDLGKGYTDKMTVKTKKELESTINSATSAKNKIREVLSAIHEGEIEDKDLKKAKDEGLKALDHLKKYLKS